MRVIADDLTGAADAGVAFAGRTPTWLVLGPELPPEAWEGNLVLDLDCRDQPSAVAAEAMARALGKVPRDAEVFVKIDSLLRGNVGAVVSAAARWAAPRPLVVAPALPSAGRRTIGGRVWIEGESGYRGRSVMECLSHLAPVLVGRLGLGGGEAGLTDRLTAGAGRPWPVLVCDAETEADLDEIVALFGRVTPSPVWVGSSGLAKAVARSGRPEGGQAGALVAARAWPRPQYPGVEPDPGGVLDPSCVVVVGSAAPLAAAQAQAVAASLGVQPVALSPADLVVDGHRVRLDRPPGSHLVVTVDQSQVNCGPLVPAVSLGLAEAVVEAVRTADIVVLTGGATARCVLDRLGPATVRILGELSPGVVLLDADARAIVTKAGSFGTAHTLAESVRVLVKAATAA